MSHDIIVKETRLSPLQREQTMIETKRNSMKCELWIEMIVNWICLLRFSFCDDEEQRQPMIRALNDL